jgi:hypothetical protein
MSEKRVLLLTGVYRADWEDPKFRSVVVPVVAGCLDETVWEHETDEETHARWATCKEAFDPRGTDYDWREVWVTLPEPALRVPFETPSIPATVEGAE